MKQYVYPVVLYFDEQTKGYTVAFNDLDLYAAGDTVEDAFLRAKEFLKAYIECLDEFEEQADEPTIYEMVVDKNEGKYVLLVDTVSE